MKMQKYTNIDCLDPKHMNLFFSAKEPKKRETPRRTAMFEIYLALLKRSRKSGYNLKILMKYSVIIYQKVR